MSFNGSGTFVINSSGQPVVANTVISATVFNALTADLATGLSTCITKDGQTTPTANIPMGTYKFTGLGNGSAATDSATLGQVQASTTKLVTVSGTDTIAGTMTPALTAYASGQMFYFVAGGANTGAVTLNIDGLGARNVTRHGSVALVAGDILSGEVCVVVYDGTRFQLLNPASYTNLNVTGTLSAGSVSYTGTLTGGTGIVNLGSGQFYKDASGNVGIGTASPGYRLDVQHTTNGIGMRVRNTSTAVELATRTDATTSGIDAGNAPNGMTFSLNTIEGMRLTSTGLGIGTASPGYRLHVERASAGITGYFYTNDGASNPRLVIYGDSNGTTLQHTFSSGAASLIFAVGGSVGVGDEVGRVDFYKNWTLGGGTLATSATDGFLYVPTCAGTPTGTPTTKTGFAPIVVNTTNNKLYFYSGGVWRDAGP